MKTIRCTVVLALMSAVGLRAQAPDVAPPYVDASTPATLADPANFTPEQLDQLLGPIALYPDALIALILPASTAPADIVLAARYLQETNNDFSQVESRAWDDSVKSLAHYPDVLKWMDQNLTWTKQLGDAFREQPAEVMKSIQRLRARARAAGTLVDTPQQQVVAEAETIRIIPAQPDVIYVPYYDPRLVYFPPAYYDRPFLSFGFGYAVGSWLAFDCDWHRRAIWVGDRHRHWGDRHDWHRPYVPPAGAVVANTAVVNRVSVRQWQPPPRAPRPTFNHNDFTRPVVHTQPNPSATWGRSAIASPAPGANAVDRVDNPVSRTPGTSWRRGPNPPVGPTPPANMAVQTQQLPANAPVTITSPTPAPASWHRDHTVYANGWQAPAAQTSPQVAPTPAPTVTSPSATRTYAPRHIPVANQVPVQSAPQPTYRPPPPAPQVQALPSPSYRPPAVSAPPPAVAAAPAAPAPAPAAAPARSGGDERRYRDRREMN